jgi:hypothetical protein
MAATSATAREEIVRRVAQTKNRLAFNSGTISMRYQLTAARTYADPSFDSADGVSPAKHPS